MESIAGIDVYLDRPEVGIEGLVGAREKSCDDVTPVDLGWIGTSIFGDDSIVFLNVLHHFCDVIVVRLEFNGLDGMTVHFKVDC